MKGFQAYQDTLNAKKFNPIPNKELNQMVIEGRELDKVVNSCQRLIMKALSKRFRIKYTPDDVLFEYVQVANANLAECLIKYTEEKIDFAYYFYVSAINAFSSYYRTHSHIVKPSIVEKDRRYASYFHIDAVSDDGDSFDIVVQEEKIEQEIDLKLIYELIKKQHHLFKWRYVQVYSASVGLDKEGGKTNLEVAEQFGISHQRACQIIKDVKDKIKSNEKIIDYLSEF
jgi:RNA polymerase sigma factor (sigma-70 family)